MKDSVILLVIFCCRHVSVKLRFLFKTYYNYEIKFYNTWVVPVFDSAPSLALDL